MPNERDDVRRVTLHLLDSAQGRPIQTWHFSGRERLTIGRATDNDVTLSDVHVSRLHVELRCQSDQWRLHSHGRNGTLVEGLSVSELTLVDDIVFQLGSSGPSLRFVTFHSASTSTPTIDDIQPEDLDFLVIDKQRTADEVRQITEGDVFQALQHHVQQLRRNDDTHESGP